MTTEQFRYVKIGDKVLTVNGGIGIIDNRYITSVSILAWEKITDEDKKHCSTYVLNELVEIVNE